jgi:23S rRNA (adenine2503-C2)-methyltransferase
MIPLTDLTPSEIAASFGLKVFQGAQVFRWVHGRGVFDFDAMTDLSKALRERLQAESTLPQLAVAQMAASKRSPGTRKALFRLRDGETVEAVLIRDGERRTICLSTQVGCAVKCTFCATGLSGYTRNLSPGEIVEQAVHLLAEEGMGERTPNIVFMGMGEPFRNYDATVAAIRLLMQGEGLGIGARRITVSTVGEVDGIRRFAREGWQTRLSISLHAANDNLRSRLVPLNRKYPIAMLMDAVSDYIAATGRQITFEWALLNGVNDSHRDATQLSELAAPLKASVNLIPYNPIGGADFRPPSPQRCRVFRDTLTNAGIKATLRKECGQDIAAACGQLRRQALTDAGAERP